MSVAQNRFKQAKAPVGGSELLASSACADPGAVTSVGVSS